jgi:glycerol-3-phosphate acyltransferase PlsY
VGSALLISYLLGAVPFALLAGRCRGIDIRKHGSGNLGATNAIRILGKPLGLTVFVLDFLKGLGPVLFVKHIFPHWVSLSSSSCLTLAFACGMAAVVGHVFPVYLRFKGGKGVAAAAGALMAVQWDAALVAFFVFILARRITGYVSVSSIFLAVSFPIAFYGLHPHLARNDAVWVILGSGLLAVLIVLRHRHNLTRILKGEEPKVGGSVKKKEGI